MYTWGYIKENTLNKLNMSEEEANQQGFLSRFPYFANEAMTQICSGVKPKETYLQLEVNFKEIKWQELTKKYGVYINHLIPITDDFDENDVEYEVKRNFWNEWNTINFVGDIITMPEDFIGFSDDVASRVVSGHTYYRGQLCSSDDFTEVGEDEFDYVGYNQIRCKEPGVYHIPYKARWFFFTKELQNYETIDAPADICDAIPSYIVSQCYKVDDEAKAAIYRNEFEIFLARIDDTSFKSQRGFKIGGGW
jgi:hypothetical protein